MQGFVKICGVRDVVAACAAIEAGANALGLVFAESPRRCTEATAREVLREVAGRVEVFGVFRGPLSPTDLRQIETLGLRTVQVHGVCGIALPAGIEVVPAGAPGEATLQGAARVVLDAPGGAGRGRPWEYARARTFPGDARVILAGGLCPENVASAIRAARPNGVDVSSGVEIRPGEKSPARIQEFVAAARAAFETCCKEVQDVAVR